MLELVLQYSTEKGDEELVMDNDKLTFGRGSDADYRFEDNGLSRLHATIYQEDGDIWIVDENSSNGTFVNDKKVSRDGTTIIDGDTIKIGHQTYLDVTIREKNASASGANAQTISSSNQVSQDSPSMLIPLAITAFALLIVGASAVFIGINAFGRGGGGNEIVKNGNDPEDIFSNPPKNNGSGFESNDNNSTSTNNPPVNQTTTQATNDSTTQTSTPDENVSITNSPTAQTNEGTIRTPTGKTYLQMSESEKKQYIAAKAMRVAQMIGNMDTKSIPPLAVERIKRFADSYAKRIRVKAMTGCRFGDNLQRTYERASKNAPFINRAFKERGLDPQIGLYLAMIESEHCVCLQSPTGPLGMFQFTRATGRNYGLSVKSNGSPSNPDERCEPRPAAVAASKYMKFLTARYGTGSSSVPLAIGSYNSGEGGLSRNLKTALDSNEGLPRDFWTLIANGEKLSKQFQSENFKYVPKFFAAAIVGENPADFGMNLRALSTYSK